VVIGSLISRPACLPVTTIHSRLVCAAEIRSGLRLSSMVVWGALK
jgi:hypothetical protein